MVFIYIREFGIVCNQNKNSTMKVFLGLLLLLGVVCLLVQGFILCVIHQ